MSGLFDQITNYSPPLLTAGQVNYKGTWSAAANSPTLVSPPASTSKGDYYVVSAAGTQFGITFAVGDWIISNGTAWEKVDLTDAVSSVFGRTGAITAASGDYTASQVTNVPAGTISSTNVQDAINELSSDIATAQNVLDAYVTNAESVAITKGQVVYAFGATGNRMSVKLALNTSDSTSAKTIGVVLDSSIGAGNPGYIRLVGVVDGLNLGSYADGDTLYLGATAGSVTNVKPYAPNHLVYVGIVERANNGNGQLYVKVQNGYELDEIHDVQITSAPASGALLVRDATNSLWKAARLTAGTNIAVTNADASVTVGVTGIIGSSNGGTGNGFTKFSGPTTAEKTFTLPNSNATLLYSGGALGTPSSGTLTSCTGLPISTGVSGLGTGIATALAVNTGSAGAPVLFNGALGTPTSGTVTNLTGTASININGTVGATTPSTGAFTTLSASGAITGSLGATVRGYSVPASGSGMELFWDGTESIIQSYNRTGSSYQPLWLEGGTLVRVGLGGVQVAGFTTTGLSVTGTLSTLATNGVNVFESAGVSSVGLQFKTNSTNRFKIETPSASNDLAFYYGGTAEVARLTSSQLIVTGSSGVTNFFGNNNLGVRITGSASTNDYTGIDFSQPSAAPRARIGAVFGSSGSYLVFGTSNSYATGITNAAMAIDYNGNVGIGTVGPAGKLDVQAASGSGLTAYFRGGTYSDIAYATGVRFIAPASTSNANRQFKFQSGDSSLTIQGIDGSGSDASDTNLILQSGGGNVLVGVTSTSASQTGVKIVPALGGQVAYIDISHANGTASGNGYTSFFYNASAIGSITQNGTTAVAYNTSSDYRLKDITGPITDSGTFIDALKPKVGTWKSDGSKFVGFLAHEFAEVSPSSVSGQKDAVDADGKPIYQAMQASSAEVIANLVAELQSVRKRLAALESN